MSLKILIADDNDSIRHRVRSCIESRTNWHVCGEAADGNLAVTLVRQLRPEIAVLDFSMPGLNGLEAAHEISSVSPNTKIVLFTVYGSEQLAKYARWVGIAAVVSKDTHKAFEHLLGTLKTIAGVPAYGPCA